MAFLLERLEGLQAWLDFEGATSPPFADENGAGRHGLAGLAIGCIFGFSSCALLLGGAAGLSTAILQWFMFTLFLSVFHAGEWYVTAAYRPKELAYKSWIINHSVPYTAVQLASALEFWLEYLLMPRLKGNWWLIAPSIMLAVASITVRIVGMAQCGENFDHIVMTRRKEGHQLVTEGIYAFIRHPAYFGFYYWSVASQMLLGNPVMAVACAFVSRNFFADRIPPEERVLVNIYGEQYKAFAQRTPILIPFVQGYVPYVGRSKIK